MEQIKRPRNNIIHDHCANKRKKLRITTNETKCLPKESITTFETLSNELIYEIFEFLDDHHGFQAFYDLNQRFANLFLNSNLPIKINISSISKSNFRRYLKHIIVPQTSRIQSLQLSNPFAADMSLLLMPIMSNFIRLETLIIKKIESDYIEEIVNHLSTLPLLSSLIIVSLDNMKNQNDIIQTIFRLSTLKYSQILFSKRHNFISLPIATNQFSSIEHLVINNKVSIDQVENLLSYVPQIRRLSFGHLYGYQTNQTNMSSISLNYLTHISLNLDSVAFNHLEFLFTHLFHHVQVLRITIFYIRYHNNNMEYLNADRWERLISTHMPNLSIFDFQHHIYLWNKKNGQLTLKARIDKFDSLFWIQRQWYFEHRFYRMKSSDYLIFYSTNPYRRKNYVLYEESNENISSRRLETNQNPVDHLCIHSTKAMNTFGGNFPNATELTLSDAFDMSRGSIVRNLNRILPLEQLSKLTLDCRRCHFGQLVELLCFTPHIHSLNLDSILFCRTDSVSIEQDELFGRVSTTNIVTNLTINKECTLEEIEMLTSLFPRLENLTISLDKRDLESIVQFLLSTSNNNTRHLSSLCIAKQHRMFVKHLRILIESKNLLHDFAIEFVNRKVYLWW